MSKLNGESLNIEEENIKKLVELFPEVNTDGKIDFDEKGRNHPVAKSPRPPKASASHSLLLD